MKRRPFTLPFIVMSIATLVLSVGCVSNPWDDFNIQAYAQGGPTKEETYTDLITLVSDDPMLPTAPEEPLVEEPTPHEKWAMLKEDWERTQAALVSIDPTYEPTEFPYPDPDLITEEMEVVEEEAVVEAPIAAEVVKEPNVSIDPPLEAFTKEDRQKSVNVANTDVPDWFIYIATVLILATLLAMCYIAKQRKEATWYRRRGD